MENKKSSIVAVALITAICLAGDSMLYIVLPTHWKEVGLVSLVEVGILLSINRFVRLPLNPIIGLFYSRVNFRSGILLAVLLSGITTLGYGFAEKFELWVVLRCVWGFAWSLFKLGAFLLILQLSTDSNRGKFMGTYNGLYRLGSLLGMLLGGFLADIYGMKVISLFLGTIAFLSIPLIYKYLPTTIHTVALQIHKHKGSSSFKNGYSDILWMLGTAFLTVMILEGMFNAMLSHIINIQIAEESATYFFIGAASLAGILQAVRWGSLPFLTPRVGSLVDKSKMKPFVLFVFMIMATLSLLIISLDIPLLIWLPFLIVHLLISSSVTTIVDTMVSELASKMSNQVKIMTVFTIIADLGAALGPILGYTFEQLFGIRNVLVVCAIIILFLSIRWLLLGKFNKHSSFLNQKNHSIALDRN
ncbi:MFS transporter [Bacillus sp. 31A1R]|uniref:MFS transporter n=1 Tax=Robertmurraya mangrovi TaxID=3098077 RepID=A0ABU5IYX0_9BACI|nr:MFS transporter [Bacillus sp. 31A1R]MDZ5472331.1 MFS transporter [Bacillus sp. 31A1R]